MIVETCDLFQSYNLWLQQTSLQQCFRKTQLFTCVQSFGSSCAWPWLARRTNGKDMWMPLCGCRHPVTGQHISMNDTTLGQSGQCIGRDRYIPIDNRDLMIGCISGTCKHGLLQWLLFGPWLHDMLWGVSWHTSNHQILLQRRITRVSHIVMSLCDRNDGGLFVNLVVTSFTKFFCFAARHQKKSCADGFKPLTFHSTVISPIGAKSSHFRKSFTTDSPEQPGGTYSVAVQKSSWEWEISPKRILGLPFNVLRRLAPDELWNSMSYNKSIHIRHPMAPAKLTGPNVGTPRCVSHTN